MNATGDVKVAVVAAGEVVRYGLARMLEQAPCVDDYAVFEPEEFPAEASQDAIQLLILSCHVLLLWTANGSGTGEDAWAGELASVARRNGILVALVLPGSEVKRAAPGMLARCDGVLEQDALTTESLDDALRRLARGERFTVEPAAPMAGRSGPVRATLPTGLPLVLLTERERQVLGLLVEGMSNKQIGQALALSEYSAKRLVAIVLSKLNCSNRTQAVAVALREGLAGGGTNFHSAVGHPGVG